jgi:prolyl 4-hydroxylase
MNMPHVSELRNTFNFAADHTARVIYRSDLPKVALITSFLTPSECEYLIAASKQNLKRSTVVDHATNVSAVSDSRSSYEMHFSAGQDDDISAIEHRISTVFNWKQYSSTGLHVVRYLPGDQFSPHFDFLEDAYLKKVGGGQRLATLIVYLNDVPAGGGTRFPDAGITISPSAGMALFFSYKYPRRASMTFHSGEPVPTGEKWIAVKWFTAET